MEHLAFLQSVNLPEVLILVLIVLLLFGANKIPQLMRSMGSGISQFKKGLKEGEKEAEAEKKAEANPTESEKK